METDLQGQPVLFEITSPKEALANPELPIAEVVTLVGIMRWREQLKHIRSGGKLETYEFEPDEAIPELSEQTGDASDDPKKEHWSKNGAFGGALKRRID